jgi:hypothetical protein
MTAFVPQSGSERARVVVQINRYNLIGAANRPRQTDRSATCADECGWQGYKCHKRVRFGTFVIAAPLP